MKINAKLKYYEGPAEVEFSAYRDGKRVAIILLHPDGDRIATATVNIPEVKLKADEVIIKDYSENVGVFQTLIDNGVIADTGRSVPCGHTEARIARLLVKP